LLGLYRLQYTPSTAWLDRFTGTLASKVSLVPPETLSGLVMLLKLMQYDCSTKPFAWVMDSTAVELMRASITRPPTSGSSRIASFADSTRGSRGATEGKQIALA
jgi:hypothetical protein